MKSKTMSRIISLLLAAVLLLGVFPVSTFAMAPQPEWAQWNETPADQVTVTATVSKDGAIILGNDVATTRMEKVSITVPYFELDPYGLGGFTRTDSNGEVIRRPTMLHAMIYLLELYYYGLSEEQCGVGSVDLTQHVDAYAEDAAGNRTQLGSSGAALEAMGGAASMWFTSYWGSGTSNIHYFRNHAEGLIRYDESDATNTSGWYSSTSATADYYLLEDGDTLDIGMFTNSPWNGIGGNAFMENFAISENVTLKAGDSYTWTSDFYDTNWANNSEVPLKWQVRNADGEVYTTEDTSLTFSYTFENAGSYTVVGYDESNGTENCIVMPAVAKVTVEAVEQEEGGQFALMAVNGDGFVIEPCYVSYAAGATVKEALKNSGHTFEGIDSGFISSINGVVDNFSLHYDGDGYSLDTEASKVTALWFTTNSSQAYSDDLLNLVSLMTAYHTSTSGVKNYTAAQEAYAAAVEDFLQTSNAKALYDDLKAAMDTFDAFGTAERIGLTMSITQGDSSLTSGMAVFTSEFGTEHSFTDFNAVFLAPATYDFDISDGTYRHIRGSITVAEGTTLTAAVPTGTWISSLDLSAASSANWSAFDKADVTEYSATYYMLDSQGASIYPYAVPADGLDTSSCKLYYRGYSYSRTWTTTATVVTAAYTGLKKDSLEGVTGVFEAVMAAGDYEQYQTFTCNIVRVPTLEGLTIQGDGTLLNTSFDSTTAVTTTSDSVDILAETLLDGVSVEVNGVSGTAVNVPLSGCTVNDDGSYKIDVVLTADNGQTNTYTVNVTKVDAVAATVTHDADVTVQITNAAGSVIAPVAENNGTDTYKLVPGETYTWLSTKNTYYHATASFTAAEGLSIAAATPKTEDWAADIGARTAAAATSQLTPDAAFTAADHTYVFTVESNTSALRVLAASASTSTYTTTIYYTSHENSLYSSLGGTNGPKNYATAITSNTTYKSLANALAVGGWGNSLRIEYKQKTAEDGVTYYQDYFVDVVRSMTLNTMKVTDQQDASLTLTQKGSTTTGFTKLVHDYTAVIASGAQQMHLTLKPLSSYRYDHDYTVTVACGDWSQTVPYSEELTPNTAQTVQIPLSGTVDTQIITVTVSHGEESSIAGTYTIEMTKLPPVATTFAVTPADATVFLTEDSTGNRIYPQEDGTYILNTEASYTYVITRNGYVAQTASFVASQENATVTVTLEAAPQTTLQDISQAGDWLQFRADTNNNGVVDTMTPIKAEDAVLEWANQIGEGMDSGATGCPIIVGGYIYTYAGTSIVKVNKDTGEVVKSGTMIGSSSFAINTPTYADGMIFVALSGGRVQAFNAETLESLWVFTDTLGGQPNCPIVYCDGYVYTGFWVSETKQAHYVCLSAADEDPSQTTEAKLPTWTYTHNGFYWAGAYACKDFVLIGTDDGAEGYTTGYASILSLDPKTGILLDEEKLTNVGDQRSAICYDEATDAYYFTTKGGDFYQIKVNADGTFTENSLRRLHLDNGSDNTTNPPMSTSTPTIYNGRAYIGVSGTGQFSAYSGHNMTVIDLETFSIAYTVPTMGYPQTSGLLTTAYENTDGYVYVYFIDNFTPGMIRVIRDKKGMTEVDHDYTTTVSYTSSGETVTLETGYILFTPYGDEAQYAICSPISDSEGNLYFKNDTARLMRLSSRLTSLEVTCQPEKLAYTVGSTFDGTGLQVVAHYANGVTKDVTQYLSYTTEPLTVDDTEITVSFDPDKQFESNSTAAGGYWQWYQDVAGQAGEVYYLPTATVNIQFIPVAQVGEQTYLTLQEAIDAAQGSCVKLLEDVTADVVVSGQLYLDLNGKELTGAVSGDGTLYGIDSATDGYDCANMGRITGTVSCTVVAQFKTDAKRYLAIADETGYTFHRFYVGVTKMSLKPNQTALGYKAYFAGDDMVKEAVSGFGIKLWVEGFEEKAVSLRYEQADFVSGKEVTARVQNIDVKNFAETDICAQAFVILGEETVESTAVSGNLRGMLEKVNKALESYTEEQKAVVTEFVKTWYSVMKTWDISNIYTEA